MKKQLVLHALQTMKRLSARRDIRGYLKRAAYKKLNIGAQSNVLAGWLNVDLFPFPRAVYMDATRRWPLPDDTFKALLCEHMIEHVSKPEAQFVLDEAYRVAARGAVVRVVTPDIKSFARLALDQDAPGAATYAEFVRSRHSGVSQCDIVNMIFYGYGHRYIYSPEELAEMMRKAGFVDVEESRGSYPLDPVFNDAEGHPRLLGPEQNAFEAFALEARKSGALPDEIEDARRAGEAQEPVERTASEKDAPTARA